MWEGDIETIASFACMYILNVYVSFWGVENLEESGAYTSMLGVLWLRKFFHLYLFFLGVRRYHSNVSYLISIKLFLFWKSLTFAIQEKPLLWRILPVFIDTLTQNMEGVMVPTHVKWGCFSYQAAYWSKKRKGNTCLFNNLDHLFIFSPMYRVSLCCNVLLSLLQGIEKLEWSVFFFAHGLCVLLLYSFCLLISDQIHDWCHAVRFSWLM